MQRVNHAAFLKIIAVSALIGFLATSCGQVVAYVINDLNLPVSIETTGRGRCEHILTQLQPGSTMNLECRLSDLSMVIVKIGGIRTCRFDGGRLQAVAERVKAETVYNEFRGQLRMSVLSSDASACSSAGAIQ